MFKFLVVICVAVLFVSECESNRPGPPCRINEELLDCAPPCQNECATLGDTCGKIQSDICIRECTCVKGYARNADGLCIKEKCCPKRQCPINEVFIKCGSPCQTTCDNLGETCNIQTLVCVNECYCRPGYARDINGRCVQIYECPIKDHKTTKKCRIKKY